MKGKIRILLFNLFLLFALLFVVEVVLRFLRLGYGDEPLENHPKFHHVFPADYRFVQYNLDNEFGGFEVYYDKNRRIAGPAGEDAAFDKNAPEIWLLGDSFVAGKEVLWKKSFAAIVQQNLPDFRISNLAVTSYSPSVYYLQLKDLLQDGKPLPAAVMILVYSNDVGNDSSYLSKAVYDESNGDLLRLDGGKQSIAIQWLRKSYLARWIRKAQLTVAFNIGLAKEQTQDEKVWTIGGYHEPRPRLKGTATEMYLNKINRLLTEKKICYLFSAVPSKYCHFTGTSDSTSFHRHVENWALENQVPYLDLTPSFERQLASGGEKCFFKKDIHFNETGHKVVATAILAYLNDRCLLETK